MTESAEQMYQRAEKITGYQRGTNNEWILDQIVEDWMKSVCHICGEFKGSKECISNHI